MTDEYPRELHDLRPYIYTRPIAGRAPGETIHQAVLRCPGRRLYATTYGKDKRAVLGTLASWLRERQEVPAS